MVGNHIVGMIDCSTIIGQSAPERKGNPFTRRDGPVYLRFGSGVLIAAPVWRQAQDGRIESGPSGVKVSLAGTEKSKTGLVP
jgi:hypothetical protein